MNDQRQRFLDVFQNPNIPVQVYRAIVISVEGNRCTVRLIPSDMEVDNVTLVSEEDGSEWVKLRPKVDSLVLVGCVENQLSDMYVVQVGEVDGGEILCGDTLIQFDKERVDIVSSSSTIVLNKNSASISQDGVKMELSDNKVAVSNSVTSLKSLFDDLGALLTSFKVVTAQGPSTALFADTLTAVTAFKTKYPQLLK